MPRLARIRSAGETACDVAVLIWLAAAGLALGLLTLMAVGLGVSGLSDLVGLPLPRVHDDPARIEWTGLALLVLYGGAGAAALAGCHLAGRHVLPRAARAHLRRAAGTLVLVGLAVAGAVLAVRGRDPNAAALAMFCGHAATRVARGLPPHDDEDDDAGSRPSAAAGSR